MLNKKDFDNFREFIKSLKYLSWEEHYFVEWKGHKYTLHPKTSEILQDGEAFKGHQSDLPPLTRFIHRSTAIREWNIRAINRRETLFHAILYIFLFTSLVILLF